MVVDATDDQDKSSDVVSIPASIFEKIIVLPLMVVRAEAKGNEGMQLFVLCCGPGPTLRWLTLAYLLPSGCRLAVGLCSDLGSYLCYC